MRRAGKSVLIEDNLSTKLLCSGHGISDWFSIRCLTKNTEPTYGVESGNGTRATQWWEASAFTTAPTLLNPVHPYAHILSVI